MRTPFFLARSLLTLPAAPQSLPVRTFVALLALLTASFFFVAEQHQRNWLLYAAAAAAHVFLLDRSTLAIAFGKPCGWVAPALLAMPVLSLAWGGPATLEPLADLALAAWCILALHTGVAHLVGNWPSAIGGLKWGLLLAANLGALLCIGHWLLTLNPTYPRMAGWLGLDNPVHAAILLLSATLPAWNGVGQGRLRHRWLLACALPCVFALLAGARTAAAAYLLIIVFLLQPGLRLTALAAGGALAGLGAAALVLGVDALVLIWLDRGLSFRWQIWAEGLARLTDCNALIGCGVGAPLRTELGEAPTAQGAHSLYLAMLHHQGAVGLALFLAALAWLLTRANRLPRKAPQRDWFLMLAYALLASLTSGDQILVRATLFWCYFWLPLMVLAAELAVNGKGSSPAGRA